MLLNYFFSETVVNFLMQQARSLLKKTNSVQPCKALTSTSRVVEGSNLAQGHFNTQTRGIEPATLL